MSNSTLRINGFYAESVVDGPGIRYAIFTQGCPHHCEGCHNPQTHDFNDGYDIEINTILDDIFSDPILQGVTFSGGEPFCQAAALSEIAIEVHKKGLNIVTFTGYLYENLLEKAKTDPNIESLLKQTDILIDGPFILAQRDLTLKFRGSRNQRILYLKNGIIDHEEK